MASIDNVLGSALKELNLTKPEETKKRDELGQEEFLELMVAQLKNQDPFAPLENGDFIAQMAQFSNVTGLTELKNSFNQLATSLQSNQALQASTLVGRSVLVPTSSAYLPQGGTIAGVVDLENSTGNVNVFIEDPAGQIVSAYSLGQQAPGRVNFVWDGTKSNGDMANSGHYKVRAEITGPDGGESLQTLISAKVESVNLNQGVGGITLNLKDLGSVAFSDVREIK